MSTHNNEIIQQEVDILYSLSLVIDRLLIDLDRRMSVNLEEFSREKKKLFNRMQDGIKLAFQSIEKLNIDIEKTAEGSNYANLDIWYEGANELCRLLLLYFEKCELAVENSNQVFKFLRSLSGGKGLIDEEVLERFYMKK